MKINKINQTEYDLLLWVYKNFPNLTYQNTGYDYPDRKNWSEKDIEAFKEVEAILKKSIVGFAKFNHFKLNKNNEIVLRLQYNYNYNNNITPFIGVGYVVINELQADV